MDLAGNAFNGHCSMAMLVVRHAVLSRIWKCRVLNGSGPRPSLPDGGVGDAGAYADPDDDFDDMFEF